MSYIFTDIDGVLNTQNHLRNQMEVKGSCSNRDWCPTATGNLLRLCRKYEGRIVVSSSWRHEYTLDELKEIFESNGIPAELVIDTTPSTGLRYDHPDYCRGDEIQRWLENSGNTDSPFLIIDDYSDMLHSHMDRLVQVDAHKGFADRDKLLEAVRILEVVRPEE